MIYRNKLILDLAHESPCQGCGAIDGTVCASHSNQQRDGKGTGIKANDYRVAYLCNTCHFEIDNGNKLSREERKEKWEEAHRATIGWLFTNGHLKVI